MKTLMISWLTVVLVAISCGCPASASASAMPATQLPTLSELLKAGDGWEALMPANSTPQMGADHPLLPRPNTPWIDGWRPWFNRFGGMC